jgi:hypothetical protein
MCAKGYQGEVDPSTFLCMRLGSGIPSIPDDLTVDNKGTT